MVAQHIRFNQIRTYKGSNQLDAWAGLFEVNKKFENQALTTEFKTTP